MRYADNIPYEFVLDHLNDVNMVIKTMFGCYGIYANGKLSLFLMNRERPLVRRVREPMQNGVYVATTTGHCPELETVFPHAEFEQLKGDKVWIFISKTIAEFEKYTVTACEMITARDTRIRR